MRYEEFRDKEKFDIIEGKQRLSIPSKIISEIKIENDKKIKLTTEDRKILDYCVISSLDKENLKNSKIIFRYNDWQSKKKYNIILENKREQKKFFERIFNQGVENKRFWEARIFQVNDEGNRLFNSMSIQKNSQEQIEIEKILDDDKADILKKLLLIFQLYHYNRFEEGIENLSLF